MTFPSLLPPADLLQQLSGIESGLQRQRRLGRLGIVAVVAAVVQALVVVLNSDLWTTLTSAQWHELFFGDGNVEGLFDKWPFVVALVVGLFAFFFLAWKRFWLKESQAPFRYTYAIDEFEALGQPDDSLRWLRHHLSKRLNDSIGRLYLLEPDPRAGGTAEGGSGTKPEGRSAPPPTYDSHIRIRGQYGARVVAEDDGCRWQLEVITRVRIGRENAPESLAHPVKFPLNEIPKAADGCGPHGAKPRALSSEEYEQVLERVYSHVATEIYRQMRRDVQHKIELLPTRYYRARAYFYEAEDYARSNTLDAYDEARKLYDAAISYFTPASRSKPKTWYRLAAHYVRRVDAWLRWAYRVTASRVWTRAAKVELMVARAQIGYANVLIFRRMLASTTGGAINPIFEARPIALEAVNRLCHLPRDVPGAVDALFDARVTMALAWAIVGSVRKAKDELDQARQLLPSRPEDDARFLYAASWIEPRPRSQLLLLERSVDLEPGFEAAQFDLAIRAENLWRARTGLDESVAGAVLARYENVVTRNPGNLSAWANRGYMLWLLGKNGAEAEFTRGRDYKSIKHDTYVAELDYGLARIAAERGEFLKAFKHFTSAMTAHFAQGLSQGSTNTWSSLSDYYFDYIDRRMLQRFSDYKDNVESAHKDQVGREHVSAVHDSVMALALNDYGEACFNYYKRSSEWRYALEAYAAYERARGLDPSYAFPLYNLYLFAQEAGGNTDVPGLRDAAWYVDELNRIEPEWLEAKLAIMSVRSAEATREEQLARNDEAKAREAKRKSEQEEGKARLSELRQNRLEEEPKAAPYALEKQTKVLEAAGRESSKQEAGHDESADAHWHKCQEARREVEGTLRTLLPHDWLWRGRSDPTLQLKLFGKTRLLRKRRFGRELRWEREFNDLHVRALYTWGRAQPLTTSRRSATARIYAHMEDCFWPDNLEILQFFRDQEERRFGARLERRERRRSWLPGRLADAHPMRRLAPVISHFDRQAKVQRRLDKYNNIRRAAIEGWLTRYPAAWWALTWLEDAYPTTLRAFHDALSVSCSTVSLQRRAEILREVVSEPLEFGSSYYHWVGASLESLRGELEWRERLAAAILEHAEALDERDKPRAVRALRDLDWLQASGRIDADVLAELRQALRMSDVGVLRQVAGKVRSDYLQVQQLQQDALKAYRHAIVNGDDPAALWPVMEAFKDLAPREEALQHLGDYGASLPDDPELLWKLGGALKDFGSWSQALAAYERAMRADAARQPDERAHRNDEYHLELGRLRWALGHHQMALAQFDKISSQAEALPAEWPVELVHTLVDSGQLGDRTGYFRLRAWLEWRQHDGARRDIPCKDAGRALLALARIARRHPAIEWRVPERFSDDPRMLPAPFPIILEADHSMFPDLQATPDVGMMIDDYLPRMRNRIRDEMGVRSPGVSIRPSQREGLRRGDYLVSLHEVTLGAGNATVGPENPYLHMVTPGIERVVRRYLDTFLGFQEVAEMSGEWWLQAPGEDRARLVQMLQRLVRQKVPLLRLRLILDTFQSTPTDGRKLHDLLDSMRMKLRDELPGAAGRGTLVSVGDGWERRIGGWVAGSDGTRFLAITADQEPALHSFLGRVADLQGQGAVLVVRDGTLRRFVQQLIQGLFADVSVISQAELGDTLPQSLGLVLAAPASRVPV